MEPFNDIITYPEIPTWTLINLYSGQELTVTEAQLVQAFPDETERMKIMSNRSPAWAVIENIYDPHRQTQINSAFNNLI
ncbi:hypothetical protein vBAbaMPhT2_236 [Acinetobacter phage vB_AbaM_PhT2]|uniref:Uncharacterized protein n=2 Tax=Hadassahvirus TaxID=2842716 RepID=A0A6B9SY79_9CAUD|nr:hypothetical protein HYP74_gp209 [Acinetobacter phage AbTZA1]YP_009887247.1 hypothetical protein HYQ24_gp202 [Acinetobacter phage vB_AbaM_PhT2]QQM13839.1 hypothetical protein CPT_Maestro_105 [Acinetobacter phage Maestro]QQM18595.1 hypothetical protein CPT_Morttis_102 [Acinetobacter phage Morttis]UQS94178.1 hypothetical protein ABNavy71_101 [Acinetobacter phage AB-Navy71]SSU39255.1 Uncharacterised protein [Acinetobacter baumannii]AZU98740.1 hypothetical protein [Acinetobacter phage AbTZA1]